jgi:solute carrier family 12 sodium/potassium/chloride transporter 2
VSEPTTPHKFGTFTGVFTPTLLTILGVILYVRLGWVVGNAGLLGAWLIMLVALGITVCTGLSLSSIATNTRLGTGGPYAIISSALGIEVGGSIGVPLYLSRPLGIAMYVFGFREGWLWIFPQHNPFYIDLGTFFCLFLLSYLSSSLAFRVQYLIMAVIVASLVSIFLSPITLAPPAEITWMGDFMGFPEKGFKGVDFWIVFAIFFPATTGILAGANMSGDLEDPRRAIPYGTLAAIAVSSIIYLLLAVWVARAGTPLELAGDYNIIIDKARWPAVVIAGLLGATFSSALASAVGGPRILLAMAEHRSMPRSDWLAKKAANGEPRNAVLVTALLSFICLMARDLNAIAPLVTMFFLITYFMINVVLLIENSLGLVSFRPSLRVPSFVPFLGAIGSLFTMFIVNAWFSLLAVCITIAVYIWMLSRRLEGKAEDVRSGIFGAIAEWAASKVVTLGHMSVRTWKPRLLVPFEDPDQLRGSIRPVLDLASPEGSVKLLAIATERTTEQLAGDVDELTHAIAKHGVFSDGSIVDATDFPSGCIVGLQALQSAFFRPNMLFLRLPAEKERFKEYGEVMVQANKTGVGVVMLAIHRKSVLGAKNQVNVWVRPDRSGWSIEAAFENNNLDLMLLTAYRLCLHWKAELNVLTVIPEGSQDLEEAKEFLRLLCEDARLPSKTKRCVLQGTFDTAVQKAPKADLNITGLQEDPNFDFMVKMVDLTHSSCLFVADSGRESARV